MKINETKFLNQKAWVSCLYSQKATASSLAELVGTKSYFETVRSKYEIVICDLWAVL